MLEVGGEEGNNVGMKNCRVIVPFNIPADYVPHFYGIIVTCFAVFYTLLGGMLSIVWTDLIQYILMY